MPYTSEEMREMAKAIRECADVDNPPVAAMLEQAADAAERTCATCQHLKDGWCQKFIVKARGRTRFALPLDFGCSLYQRRPAGLRGIRPEWIADRLDELATLLQKPQEPTDAD